MSDVENLQPKAFFVTLTDDFDPKKAPQSGYEYLQHVMYEASQHPSKVVASVPPNKVIKKNNVQLNTSNVNIPSQFAPSIGWQRRQVAQFSQIRQKIDCVYRVKYRAKIDELMVPPDQTPLNWYSVCCTEQTDVLPTLTTMLPMRQQEKLGALKLNVQYLKKNSGLGPKQGLWIYSILTCLELPLPSEAYCTLRELATECCRLRATKTAFDDDVVTYNIIICLVALYFGQGDLQDKETMSAVGKEEVG